MKTDFELKITRSLLLQIYTVKRVPEVFHSYNKYDFHIFQPHVVHLAFVYEQYSLDLFHRFAKVVQNHQDFLASMHLVA